MLEMREARAAVNRHTELRSTRLKQIAVVNNTLTYPFAIDECPMLTL